MNVILDLVGASHFPGNIECLTVEGKLLLVGVPSGTKAEANLALVCCRMSTACYAVTAFYKPMQAHVLRQSSPQKLALVIAMSPQQLTLDPCMHGHIDIVEPCEGQTPTCSR